MQNKTWCSAVAISLIGTMAAAQNLDQCSSIDAEDPGSATAMAACIGSLSTALSDAEDANRALEAALRLQQEAARAERVQLAADIDSINRIFNQAIIAFNRSEAAGGACPQGWSLFDAAGGRVLVGAGEHSNEGLSEYPSFADDPVDATGGVEAVQLSISQLPSHRHGLAYISFLRNPGFQDGGRGTNIPYFDVPPANAANNAQVEYVRPENGALAVGSGAAHENRPPFLAVYFCIRE